MAYLPISTTFDSVFTIVGPDGSTAVFNDPTSANYVGTVTEVTGLDSAEVRESATDLTESDGGAHGPFYEGRRPVTINCKVYGHATVLERAERIDRARRATRGLRADATLSWTPTFSGAPALFIPVRRQQPFRESGTWVKDIQIALVSQHTPIFSQALHTVNMGVASENLGNYPAYPIVTITGPSTNPTVSDGARVLRTALALASGEVVEFDMLNHSGVFTAGARAGQSANRYINWDTTSWCYLPGLNTAQTFALTGGGSATIKYRDCWA
jgi:hypothetical protein